MEITEYYQEDKELILFDTIAQAEEKFIQYLDNIEQANFIRLTSQNRTLKDHTYTQRARVFLEKIEKGMIRKTEKNK